MAKQISWFAKHWILSIFLVIILFWMIGSLSNTNSDAIGNAVNVQNQEANSQQTTKEKLASLEPEINALGSSLTSYRIINRNDYAWQNVKITVNDYYSCWSRDILWPGEIITVEAADCKGFVVNNQMVTSLLIESDEGVARYSLR